MTPERRKEIKAKYRETHREELRKKGREYIGKRWLEDRDRMLQIAANSREKNREKIRIRARERTAKHPEDVRAACKKWREKNIDYARERCNRYCREHPEKNLAAARRRRAFALGAPGGHTKKEIDALLMQQKGKCADCRKRFTTTNTPTLDHVVPISKGGSESIENLRWVCQPCNSRKYNKSPEEWAARTGRLFI